MQKMDSDVIRYSEKYNDNEYEYRHVILPKILARKVPFGTVLTEPECYSLGIQQSRGWQHYGAHKPEPHVLLFRRLLGQNSNASKTNLPSEK